MNPPLAPTLEAPASQPIPRVETPRDSEQPPSCLSTGPRSLTVALGFGTTVVMWAIGYACMTAPGLIVGEVLFVIELLALVCGGYVAGRLLGTVKAGAWTGVVSATVNLLIVGSLFRRGEDGSILASAVSWVLGLYVVSILLASVGAAFGVRSARPRALPSATGMFSLIAAGTVFLLLTTGGLVTGLEAGLAVPDWPNSFGHNMLLYPLAEMSGGIYYEHAHRLYGMLVGVTTIALLAMVFIHDRRGWMRGLIAAVFVMVCVQGLMGGLRVTGEFTLSQENTTPSIILAIAHGIFGQVVFAGFCLLAIASTRLWTSQEPARDLEGAGLDRGGSILLPIALVFQLFLGACYRHLQIPATADSPGSFPAWALVGHLSFAVVVLLLAILVGLRTASRTRLPLVPTLGKAVLVIVSLQFLLGVGALVAVLLRADERIPLWELISTSAHQANGALLLGVATALAAITCRLIAPYRYPDPVGT